MSTQVYSKSTLSLEFNFVFLGRRLDKRSRLSGALKTIMIFGFNFSRSVGKIAEKAVCRRFSTTYGTVF